jgi:hypothetical protein
METGTRGDRIQMVPRKLHVWNHDQNEDTNRSEPTGMVRNSFGGRACGNPESG